MGDASGIAGSVGVREIIGVLVVVVVVEGEDAAKGGGEVTNSAHTPVRGDQMIILV